MNYKIIKHIKYPDKVYYTSLKSRFGIFWRGVVRESDYYDDWAHAKHHETEMQALEDVVTDKQFRRKKKREVIWDTRKRVLQ